MRLDRSTDGDPSFRIAAREAREERGCDEEIENLGASWS